MSLSLIRRPRLLCLLCQQSRAFSTSYRLLAEAPKPTPNPAANAAATPKPAVNAQLADAPRSYGKRLETFTPTPLSRPIGLTYAPQEGQNTGLDERTLKQRRDDFVNYEKHLERREYLKKQVSRPYFRDWGNLKFHKGKTFVAPPRIFRGELALYFPNLSGRTLSKTDAQPQDTTTVLRGRISVVTVFSGVWAENQTKTFVSAESNPEVERLIAESGDRAQHVRINVEEDPLKAMLVRLYMGSLRKQFGGEKNHGRYFLVRKGITDEIREAIGILNSKVGYTYLLDADCRIRWAGSGPSEEHERESLVKGLQRLLDGKSKAQ